MPIKPINLKDLEEKVENIYESIVVLSKRAQQVNEELKIEFNQRLETVLTKLSSIEPDESEPMEVQPNPDQLLIARDFEKRAKPTGIAIDELLNDKLQVRYKDDATK
ncbi:MAG: DNA-directed RNA polymerase subunit omega [Bacteroidetes bacterium]|nr:DNA-directed RNA polymerase subunit omega [Bacteroidota bacterium]MBU1422778.1 DNA-directed RNA polymerase subunit omega [Bacteroidota bacterium]MBU2471794.1 DNA-directed RNA polymerase subunit omega [Bacteroidota bacterium]MBU2636852.1 DNA-directed RNA polymerase subunit omega [Bacteroidota bacterium]